jgi:hypothetical protein
LSFHDNIDVFNVFRVNVRAELLNWLMVKLWTIIKWCDIRVNFRAELLNVPGLNIPGVFDKSFNSYQS